MTTSDLIAAAAARGWPLEHHCGSAAAFHQRNVPASTGRALWWFEVTRPTVVLGSTQRVEAVDAARAASLDVEVARRRSGGGSVWLAPGHVSWVDVVLPAGDPLWDDDVGRASHWLGAAWSEALDRLGRPGAAVHRDGLVRTAWSELVCFGGLGPGEVTIDGAKVIGISQRRTRAGARFQCAVLHHWDPAPLLDCCRLSPADRIAAAADLADRATGIGPVEPAAVVAALVAALPESI